VERKLILRKKPPRLHDGASSAVFVCIVPNDCFFQTWGAGTQGFHPCTPPEPFLKKVSGLPKTLKNYILQWFLAMFF
jgi:hypothetical protein